MTTDIFLAAATALMFGGLAAMVFIFNKVLDQIHDIRVRENYTRRAGRSLLFMCMGCSFLFVIIMGYLICEYLLCAASA